MTVMNDRRVFSNQGEWWFAQARRLSHGSGWGADPSNEDRVVFTSLSDTRRKSQSATIRVGQLTKLPHRDLVALLQASKSFPERLPPPDDLLPQVTVQTSERQYTDAEELRWVFVKTELPQIADGQILGRLPAVEALCLDDSALRFTIPIGTVGQEVDLSLLGDVEFNDVGRSITTAISSTFTQSSDDWASHA